MSGKYFPSLVLLYYNKRGFQRKRRGFAAAQPIFYATISTCIFSFFGMLNATQHTELMTQQVLSDCPPVQFTTGYFKKCVIFVAALGENTSLQTMITYLKLTMFHNLRAILSKTHLLNCKAHFEAIWDHLVFECFIQVFKNCLSFVPSLLIS